MRLIIVAEKAAWPTGSLSSDVRDSCCIKSGESSPPGDGPPGCLLIGLCLYLQRWESSILLSKTGERVIILIELETNERRREREVVSTIMS